MTGSQNQDHEAIIVDLIDDAVVTCADSPLSGATNELSCFRRTRITRQQVDSRLNTAASLRIKFAQLTV